MLSAKEKISNLLAACLVAALVATGHFYGLQRQDEDREELRQVTMFDVETVEKTLNGQRVYVKMGSFSRGLNVFQMPVSDEMLQDYWSGHVAGTRPPPQVRMDLFLSQSEMRMAPEEKWYDVSSAESEYFSFIIAAGIFLYMFVMPAVDEDWRKWRRRNEHNL